VRGAYGTPKDQNRVALIMTSDWHGSARAPAARSAEPDWRAAQGRYLAALAALQKEHGGCPIAHAGELFWKTRLGSGSRGG